MGFWENIALAFAGLKSNKMRSFLTMLGIIIGISSVIAISTLGSIMEASVMDIFNSQGGSNLVGFQLTMKQDAARDYIMNEDFITGDMVKSVQEKFGDEIDAIILSAGSSSGKLTLHRKDYDINLYGVNSGYVKSSMTKVIAGRYHRKGLRPDEKHLRYLRQAGAEDVRLRKRCYRKKRFRYSKRSDNGSYSGWRL